MTQILIKDVIQPQDVAPHRQDQPVVIRPRTLTQFLNSRSGANKRVQIHVRPWQTSAVLFVSDLAALFCVIAMASWVQLRVSTAVDLSWHLRLFPLPLLFIIIYACAGLYPAIPLSPPFELRRLTLITTTVCLSAATAAWLVQGSTGAPLWTTLGLSWPLSIVMVPLARSLVRQIWSSSSWWGYPAVILGSGPVVKSIANTLVMHPKIGLKPVAIIGDSGMQDSSIAGVPVFGRLNRIREFARENSISYAIVPMSRMSDRRTSIIIRRYSRLFKHVMIIPPITHFSSLWISPVDLDGLLGLESRCRLLDPGRQTIKRAMDLTLVALGALVWLPCVAMIAAAIKIESKGPVFFTQSRPGLKGRKFRIVKFRTMFKGAHYALNQCINQTHERREEWAQTGKLRDDPRVTYVGRFLRRTSLDELPQIWNVIKGDMSLVGPRPILHEQRDQYRSGWAIYMRVRPGITGAWQVSGRNTLSIAQRIHLDTYYVRNWSVWLDIYFLSKTVATVLQGRGAY